MWLVIGAGEVILVIEAFVQGLTVTKLHNPTQSIRLVCNAQCFGIQLYTHRLSQSHCQTRCVYLQCTPLYHPEDQPTRPATFEKEIDLLQL